MSKHAASMALALSKKLLDKKVVLAPKIVFATSIMGKGA